MKELSFIIFIIFLLLGAASFIVAVYYLRGDQALLSAICLFFSYFFYKDYKDYDNR